MCVSDVPGELQYERERRRRNPILQRVRVCVPDCIAWQASNSSIKPCDTSPARADGRCGIYIIRQSAASGRKREARNTLNELVDSGEIIPDDYEGKRYYKLKEELRSQVLLKQLLEWIEDKIIKGSIKEKVNIRNWLSGKEPFIIEVKHSDFK